MIREKRIVKPPIVFEQVYKPIKRNLKPSSKKLSKVERCEFKIIPNPPKFTNDYNYYPVLGGIGLIEKNGRVSSEISAFNKYLNVKKVEVLQRAAMRLVQIDTEQKKQIEGPSWEEMIRKFESSESPEMRDWSLRLKSFMERSNELLVLDNERVKSEEIKVEKMKFEEMGYAQITKKSEEKKSQLLEFLPCVHQRIQIGGTNSGFTQMTFNNLFLKEIGHSIDAFTTSVLLEGIPQFTSYDSEMSQYMAKIFFENCFDLGEEGIISPELDFPLFLKNNYVRGAKAQAHFLMSYIEGNFFIDIVIVIVRKDEPHLNCDLLKNTIVNQAFITEMAEFEKDRIDFMENYYQTSFTQRYMNFERVCTIKELN